MKLVVPHTAEVQASDARLIRLADFLGISCKQVFLDKQVQDYARYIEEALRNQACCLVINPQVIRDWTRGVVPADLISCLTSRFPYIFVHGLSMDPLDQNLIEALSGKCLHSVRAITNKGQLYKIASDSREVCGAFSGLSFGPVNPVNDRIFSVDNDKGSVQTAIYIGASPFMAVMKREKAEIVFVGSADLLDVNDEIDSTLLSEHFSRFVPHAMALRHIFGEESWHPCEHHASIIIDDPLLRPQYGFLNFESLLRLMKEHNFSTTVAFIPHNYRRNSKRVVEMFRGNDNRLAICFHGNDHTAAEFASKDTSRLNTMIHIAEARMNIHRQATGLPCHKVMVFPQGNFSVEAMGVLKSSNFCAAVNSVPHPTNRPAALTLAELAQPAVLRYGEFPLFLRKSVREIKRQDIAFNLFFGRPVLVVEHHDVFRQPETLVQLAFTINSFSPRVRWSNVERAIESSTLRRKLPEGTYHIRAYSGTVRIANNQEFPQRFLVEWNHSSKCPAVEQVLRSGELCQSYEVDDCGIRASVELASSSCEEFSVVYRNDYRSFRSLGFQWNAKALVRRRLSEVRDNYVSKNRYAMKLLKPCARF
jgi:hypothetical protein